MAILAKDLKTFLASINDDATLWIDDGQLVFVQVQLAMGRIDTALQIGGEDDDPPADAFEAHRTADPHCTCNDCMEHYAAESLAASDAADARADAAGWHAEGGTPPLKGTR